MASPTQGNQNSKAFMKNKRVKMTFIFQLNAASFILKQFPSVI